MAKAPADVKLGAAGTQLMEFMQQGEAQEPRGPAKVIESICYARS